MMTLRNLLLTSVATVASLLLPQSSFGQTVPFKSSGTDAGFNPVTGEYCGVGTGTHLGLHLIEGQIAYDGVFFPAPGVFFAGTFSGTQVSTAANGDTLELELSGTVILEFNDSGLVVGTWFPDFTITGGTGRFANASGTLAGVAINPPFDPTAAIWGFNWSISGKIDLGKN